MDYSAADADADSGSETDSGTGSDTDSAADEDAAESPDVWDDDSAAAYLRAQDPEELSWIREEFWGAERGLSGADGSGPVVVAGHTPTPYLERMARDLDRAPLGGDGLARMVRVGADRWDIDCCAAGGAGVGQVLILRLDDGEEFYEPVREGE